MRRWTAALLALLMLWAPQMGLMEEAEPSPTPTITPYGETMDGELRVLLSSLGTRTALGLTLDGAYSVDGDRRFQFEPGTTVSLGLDGDHIALKTGGLTIDMGTEFTLLRHLDETGIATGAYIHESDRNTLYCGNLAFSVEEGSLRVILTINIEDYLYGVVPYEMSDAFPIEALKAQAVAARTYAMQRKARGSSSGYDVVDTTNDQVYRGLEPLYTRTIQAVDETRGVVGMYKGKYAECFYSASNGGQTALATDVWNDGDFDYMDMRDDPYDLENPQSVVKQATVTPNAKEMNEALYTLLVDAVKAELIKGKQLEEGEAVGLQDVLSVEAIDPVYGGESRQYGTVRFTVTANVRRYIGEESVVRMLGELETLEDPITVDLSYYDQVRQALHIGINSSRYELLTAEETEGGFLLTSRRFGHGVGMSQRGAQQMADAHGMHYLDILGFYYPGMEIMQIDWTQKELTQAEALPQSLNKAAPKPTPAPTPAPLPPLEENEYYAVVTVEGVLGTLNVRSIPSLEGKRVAELRNGSRLIVIEEVEDGWAHIKTVEVEGYVSMDFLAKE